MTSFKTPARLKRESLLDKVLAPLTQAEREALRMAFISGISKSDIEALLDDVGLSNLVKYQNNDVNGGITKIWTGTQAQYDALAVKDDSTLYVIVAG